MWCVKNRFCRAESTLYRSWTQVGNGVIVLIPLLGTWPVSCRAGSTGNAVTYSRVVIGLPHRMPISRSSARDGHSPRSSLDP